MVTKKRIDEIFKSKDNGFGLTARQIADILGMDARQMGVYLSNRDDYTKVSRFRYKFEP